MARKIADALPDELRHDFSYLMSRLECAETDAAASDAKLRGDWPGWEWIKEARRIAETTQTP